jgi:molybdopterin molybdotransferase
LDLEEALQQIRDELAPTQSRETISVANAKGRVLAESVHAPVDLPPFPASAMDGYALALPANGSIDAGGYTVIGESLAGHPYQSDKPVLSGECIRVFTGGVCPPGTNQVIPQEEVGSLDSDRVSFKPHRPSESFVRPVGHDITQGALLLERGTRLGAFAIGSLASAGLQNCRVYSKLTVGVFSTGDELVDATVTPENLQPGQIYDSNRITVLNLLANEPCNLLDLGRLPDDAELTSHALRTAATECDVLITSGGVSVGDADFVTAAIAELGELNFWKLNLKPGKPLAFGRIGKCILFGLPGNPVSTIVTLLLVAKPSLRHVAGVQESNMSVTGTARLEGSLAHTPGRAEYQRGSARWDGTELTVSSTGDQASNRLSSFKHSNCLIHIPKDAHDLLDGSIVELLLFEGILS